MLCVCYKCFWEVKRDVNTFLVHTVTPQELLTDGFGCVVRDHRNPLHVVEANLFAFRSLPVRPRRYAWTSRGFFSTEEMAEICGVTESNFGFDLYIDICMCTCCVCTKKASGALGFFFRTKQQSMGWFLDLVWPFTNGF